MDMQIVENWTDVEGEVEEVKPSDISEDFVSVRLGVSHAKPVKGFANLVDVPKGQSIAVQVPKQVAVQLKKGAKIVTRVRRATNKNIFAHPDLTKAG